MVADLGEELGRHVQIGGDDVLGKTIGHFRVVFQEVCVAFFGRAGNGGDEPPLHKRDAPFGHHPEKGLEPGVFGFQALFVIIGDLQYLAVFHGYDEHTGGLLEQVAVIIRDPPFIDRQLHGMFFTLLVDHVSADSPCDHKIFVPVNEIGLDDELPFFEPFRLEGSTKYGSLLFCKLNKFVDVFNDGVPVCHMVLNF